MSASVRAILAGKIKTRIESVLATAFAEVGDRPLVFTRRDTDLLKKIENEIASPRGVAVFVFIPLPNVANPNLPGPVFKDVGIKVRVIENTSVEKPAERTADHLSELILRALHLWKPDDLKTQYLRAESEPIEEVEAQDRIIEDVHLTAPSGLSALGA